MLEELEATRLLLPRLRLRFPDPVARRMWLESHGHMPRTLQQPVEPDGPRWEAAVDLSNALYRRGNVFANGNV